MSIQSIGGTIHDFVLGDSFVPFASAVVGAVVGSLVTQIATGRFQTKQSVVAELNAVRAALTLCFAICNRFIALKRQFVRPMQTKFDAARREYDRIQELAKTHRGPERLVYKLSADLQTTPPITLPHAALETQLFEKTSVGGRAIVAAVDLFGAFEGLQKAIDYRNELIAEFHSKSPIDHEKMVELYFGVPTRDGVTDERFSATVKGITLQTDDCIFFSRILADDLVAYGKRLRRRYAWRFRLRVPKFEGANWRIAEQQGLIPPSSDYKNWLRGFQPRTTWYRRVLNRLRRATTEAPKAVAE